MTLSLVPKNENVNDELIDEIRRQRHNIDLYQAVGMLNYAQLTKTNREELARIYDVNLVQINQQIKRSQVNQEVISELGQCPKHEYEFVELSLEKWNTRMNFEGIFKIGTEYKLSCGTLVTRSDLESLTRQEQLLVKISDPKTLTAKDVLAKLIRSSRELKLTYTERNIVLAFEDWIINQRNQIKGSILSGLAYVSKIEEEMARPEWQRLVQAITDVNQEETLVVLKHFIWQVKRKMFDLPVRDHMMPVLFGAQGSGKSTLVRDYVCKPIREFTASTDFGAIVDGRNHDIWQNYVLIFDEMGRSTVSHIEDIKRKITEDRFSSRILGRNTDTVIINRSTMIGTTNKDISRLLFDDTGMRRFYQIDCRSQMDWASTSTVKYDLLWRSIDERKDSPLFEDSDLLQRVKRIQNSKRQITMLELWLRERKYKIDQMEIINGDDLYGEYVEFHKKNNNDRCDINNQNFGRSIMDVALNIQGLTITKKRLSRGVQYTLTYSQEINLDLMN